MNKKHLVPSIIFLISFSSVVLIELFLTSTTFFLYILSIVLFLFIIFVYELNRVDTNYDDWIN